MNESQKEYPVINTENNNYVLFKELGSDSMGTDSRAAELEDRKPVKHLLLTKVYPYLSTNPNIWKRVNILLEGVKKSNIPKLYSPDQIVQEAGKTFLVYPLLKGRTLEQVLDDSDKKNNPINFDLVFSIALAIADLIDTGSSIVVSGEKSFHGFLTPDNIIIDYDGKIFLKNYGIYPYLSREEDVFNETVKRYGAWIAPEFLRKEKLVSQTDIYHLGYIIYRVLTGKYFSCSPDEDFNAKFANISFSHHIPSSDKEFLTAIITFFQKTLHPQPSQRFSNIKAFKDYISNKFHIEELSSVTFNLAYYMNSLYLEAMEVESRELEKEMTYVVPEKIVEPVDSGRGDRLVEDILSGLDDQKKNRNKLILPLVAVIIIIIAISAFIIISQQKQAQENEARLEEQRLKLNQEMAQMKEELKNETDRRIEAIRAEATTSNASKEEMDLKIKQIEDRYKEKTATLEKQYTEKITNLDSKAETGTPQDKPTTKETGTVTKPVDTSSQTVASQGKPGDTQEKTVTTDTKAGNTTSGTTTTPVTNPNAGAKTGETTTPVQPPVTDTKTVTTPVKKEVYEGDLIGLNQATRKPEQLKGKSPVFSSLLRKKYKGTNTTIRTMLLIDETGSVTDIKMLANTPEDLKSAIVKALMQWHFSPAEKDKVKVKVWFPVAVQVNF